MYDIAIILAPPSQHQALRALLKAHRNDLNFILISAAEHLAAIPETVLSRARLIAFATDVIVPASVLKALGYGAYNFHPGPPSYPGWAPAHFALYDGARWFGATAHHMVERVDAGPVVGVESFAMPAGISIRELEQIAYIRMARLFWSLAKRLVSREPLPALPVAWGTRRTTRQMYVRMCDIPADIDKAELNRRLAAFDDDFRGIPLTVTIHGVKFKLTPSASHLDQPTRDDATQRAAAG
ncbi:MAG: Methionyl-tRNA formyltransferase [Pseudolabrys sp.]|nr:Methionyl-tRNA formyltransferase [Pseudolabrys sp.]